MDSSGSSEREKRLKDFPHSFQLDRMQLVNDKKRKALLDKMVIQRETENICLIEQNRNDNFASFLLFLLKDVDAAIKKNSEVLDRDSNNIVALANRVRFLYTCDSFAAEEITKQLEEMKKSSSDFAWMHAVAEAELAFCLASISPPCYSQAVKKYRSVNDKYPSMYLWKFGEALTIRRGVTLNSYSKELGRDLVTNTLRCNELLIEIAHKADAPLNAKAWVQLGDLSNLIDGAWPPFVLSIVEEIKGRTSFVPREICYENALQLGSNDAFVLGRCGSFYRNKWQLDKSKTLLEDSIKHQETSYAHHHLALTLKKMAKRKPYNEATSSTAAYLLCRPNRNLKFSKDDAAIICAIDHLRKSSELSQDCNISALNELGFTYIQLDDYEEAEDIFRKIIKYSYEIHVSPVFTINAYEQTGICCLKRSKTAGLSQKDSDRLSKESLFYLTSAVEAAARFASEISSIRLEGYEQSDAFRTLTDMLRSEGDSRRKPTKLKEMARLYELVGKYKKSLDIYQKLCLENPAEADDPDISIRIIDNYLHVEDFDNAKLCLSLLLCTNQACTVPTELVNRVYLESARHYLQGGESQRAHDSFRRAFEFKYGSRKEDEDGFDLMILHDDANTNVSENIETLFNTYTGLNVTRNLEAAFGGDTEISSYELLMSSSRCLIIVLGPSPPNKRWMYWIQLAVTIFKSKTDMAIICLTTGSDHPVTALEHFSTGRTPRNVEDSTWLFDVFPLITNPRGLGSGTASQ